MILVALIVNAVYTVGMEAKREDKAMGEVRSRFKKSGLSLHELGLKMGYDAEIARQSAFQFMKTGDPRISMLRRFAAAMNLSIEELVSEGTRAKRKGS
jgi:transcriptional regulator with XRE-family HTH domain